MIGVIHFPHRFNSKIKTITRLCVLPEYQGIGIGKKFLDIIANIYFEQGYDVKITTSAKNLIFGLTSSNKWALTRYGCNTNLQSKIARIQKKPESTMTTATFLKSARKVKTATFFYKGEGDYGKNWTSS